MGFYTGVVKEGLVSNANVTISNFWGKCNTDSFWKLRSQKNRECVEQRKMFFSNVSVNNNDQVPKV